MNFESLNLHKSILKSLAKKGYKEPTPIQEQTIPLVLAGRDVVGCAQTGTGKTAAFALPTIHRILELIGNPTTGAEKRRQRSGRRVIRCLILSPTRELAGQISDNLDTYSEFTTLRNTVVYGGVKQYSQVKALKRGVDILVATPGRLIDLGQQGYVDLTKIDVLILDEADQMLDMGFIPDLTRIVAKCNDNRQTLMFSATMAPEIRRLSKQWLNNPEEIQVAPDAATPDLVEQSLFFVDRQDKQQVLTELLRGIQGEKTLVFTRTKRGADKVTKRLSRDGIKAMAIHGDKSQSQRRAAMERFKSKRPPVLIATDLASRGLDFSDISHVINYELPQTPEVYVHRIGRTARAGRAGIAISFCAGDERKQLRLIERLMRESVPVKPISMISEALVGVVKELPEEEAPTPSRKRRSSHPGRRRWHARNNSGKSKSNGGNRRKSKQQ
ncbi:MAG: DEAD/DEAH box helicase [Pirellulaceae bacterium]|nr:DEAD/DEAH box helicase [Pirellulaceae bacterium]